MRVLSKTAPVPRIRALGPSLMRRRAAPPAPPSGGVFRDFVAALERLERGRKGGAARSSARESAR